MPHNPRPTCTVDNRLGRAIVLKMIDPRDTRAVTLQPGLNTNLDKALLDAWREQNPGAFEDHLLITDDE
jgi:hypothetical protein